MHNYQYKPAWQFILDKFFPRVCVSCGLNSENADLDLCDICAANLPWLDNGCYKCGLVMSKVSEAIICDKCQETPPPFDRLCALFAYQPPLTKLIGGLKFGRQLYSAELFGNLLAEKISQTWYLNKSLPQIIIPVPLHEKRHRHRGYNQAAEISTPLAKKLGIPLGLDVCTRVRETKAQARLHKDLRTKNLLNAFSVNMTSKYNHVALVDDVVTTGSTIRAVSYALQKGGVDCIDIWCICRA